MKSNTKIGNGISQKGIEAIKKNAIIEVLGTDLPKGRTFKYVPVVIQELIALADEGDPEAMVDLAERYLHGDMVKKNLSTAECLLAEAADLGYGPARYRLGCYYLNECKDWEDQETVEFMAFHRFLEGSRVNHAESANMLGKCYQEGWGVDSDLEKARAAYTRAMELGNIPAISNLAASYLVGEPMDDDRDQALAVKLYEQAIQKGDTSALIPLAELCDYIAEHDCTKFQQKYWHHKGTYWYRKAALAGDREAQYEMAFRYVDSNGKDEEVNYDLHIYWLFEAAVRGHKDALDVVRDVCIKDFLMGESSSKEGAEGNSRK